MIIDYNESKGGVNTLDKMCAAYDCARGTERWPMVIFYALLNIAGVNSMVLFHLQNIDHRIHRRKCLHILVSELADNYLRARVAQTNIPRTISVRLKKILGLQDPQHVANAENTRGCCHY
ncbi:Transposase IS4 [Popillia japonica]|uniref:Transposase IS4 n=1 Tax=Popillia japonica TaxID=7064 RepID=A0AAW1HSV0_POPJA